MQPSCCSRKSVRRAGSPLPSATVTLQAAVTVPAATSRRHGAGSGCTGGRRRPSRVSRSAACWRHGHQRHQARRRSTGTATESFRLATIRAPQSSTITASFTKSHAGSADGHHGRLAGFATGTVPPSQALTRTAPTRITSSCSAISTATASLVYVEYFCDNGDLGTSPSHNLYRNLMAYDAASKPAVDRVPDSARATCTRIRRQRSRTPVCSRTSG